VSLAAQWLAGVKESAVSQPIGGRCRELRPASVTCTYCLTYYLLADLRANLADALVEALEEEVAYPTPTPPLTLPLPLTWQMLWSRRSKSRWPPGVPSATQS
jgi:hypothetical protein